MKIPTKRLRTKKAGDTHAVVTVKGGDGLYRRTPCETCPWRRDMVGQFPPEAFRHSARTGAVTLDGAGWKKSEAYTQRLGEASHTFGCHSSGIDKPATCAGYILKGQDALGWRIAASTEKFHSHKVSDAGLPLFDNYYEMAVANGVPADDPTIAPCKLFVNGEP